MHSICQHHFLYPLAASPWLQDVWEDNGHFFSPGLISPPSPATFPQNRMAISRLPTGKGCRPMPSPRSCYGLACCRSKPCWGMCWQLNSAEPWPWFVQMKPGCLLSHFTDSSNCDLYLWKSSQIFLPVWVTQRELGSVHRLWPIKSYYLVLLMKSR